MTNLATSRAVDPGYGGKRRWVIVGLLSLGMIIAYVSRTNLSVVLAIPSFIKSFHLSDTDRGMLNSAFFWAYAALQIPAGWVVDRYGVKFPYAFSFVFWCMASASTAFAHSVTQLVTLRVLLGVAESIVAPASLRWIRCHFIETERGLAVGLYMTGTKIGPAIAVPLAAWLTMLYGWRPMFLLLGLGGAVWLIPWLLLVRNDDPQIASQVTQGSREGACDIWPSHAESGDLGHHHRDVLLHVLRLFLHDVDASLLCRAAPSVPFEDGLLYVL